MTIGRFYAMVGALLRSPSDGTYLILKRSADKDFAAGAWECVTGRVDQGESFSQALRREVSEELGLDVQPDFIIGTVRFHRGETKPANEMVGVLYCCSVKDPGVISPSWEHSEVRWVTPEDAEELFPEDYWLRRLILRAETIRRLLPDELLVYHKEVGFEL